VTNNHRAGSSVSIRVHRLQLRTWAPSIPTPTTASESQKPSAIIFLAAWAPDTSFSHSSPYPEVPPHAVPNRRRPHAWRMCATASAVDVCVEQMGSKPCRQNDPSEWAHQWHDFVANFCGGVARGNVQTGDTCMRRSDCIERHDICIEGACRHALPADLLASCTPTGTAGTLSQSEECKTGACINTGFGGNCTVDCRTGRGCVGDDLACVRLSVSGGPSNSFCLSTCTTDAQCDELVCQSIDPMDPMGDLYCLHAVAAAGCICLVSLISLDSCAYENSIQHRPGHR
jgi:hypothetical protein